MTTPLSSRAADAFAVFLLWLCCIIWITKWVFLG